RVRVGRGGGGDRAARMLSGDLILDLVFQRPLPDLKQVRLSSAGQIEKGRVLDMRMWNDQGGRSSRRRNCVQSGVIAEYYGLSVCAPRGPAKQARQLADDHWRPALRRNSHQFPFSGVADEAIV